MTLKIIETDSAPAAVGPYSQAVVSGDLLYCSGQIPFDKNGLLSGNDIATQTDQCLKNLLAICQKAGTDFSKAIKLTLFITDMNDFTIINEIYSNYFLEHKPARACVEVSALPKGVKIEIEGIFKI